MLEKAFTTVTLLAIVALSFSAAAFAQTTILNVSYDVSRELYKEINPAFEASWKAKTAEAIRSNSLTAARPRQVLSVLNGLEADIVTMNQAPHIEVIAEKGLIAKNWRDRLPFQASPYTTTTVFVVRKGNPKAIKNWDDLTRNGLEVIVPNPKTSGNGRYTYLSAWGYALQKSGDAAAAKDFVAKLFANVPVLDGGGRGATTTFAQNGIGDVLITFENEAIALGREFGAHKFEIVYPSISIEAAPPAAVVDAVVEKRGTRKAATAYLDFLFSSDGQEIIAKHDFRPRDAQVATKACLAFPGARNVPTVEGLLGGWAKVQSDHFSEGGVFDQIFKK